MKKLTFAAAVALTIAVLGTSCTKTPTTPAAPGSAMLTLNMELNTNEANDTLPNNPTVPATKIKWDNNFPADFVVQFVYNSKGLQENPASGFVYDEMVVKGTYANGKVSVSIPAIAKGDSVKVKFPNLELTRTWKLSAGTAGIATARDTTEMRVYERPTDTHFIWDGAMLVRDHVAYSLRP